MHIRCLTRSTWKDRNGKARSAGETTPCSVGDAQVVSCRHCLVVFHPFVEQLTVFHTSGLVLPSSSILDLDLHAIARWHPEHKPVYFNRKPVMDRHTNIQAQPQTKALLAPAAPARL